MSARRLTTRRKRRKRERTHQLELDGVSGLGPNGIGVVSI